METDVSGTLTAEDLETGFPLYLNGRKAREGAAFRQYDLLSIGPPKGLNGREHCHKCSKETEWQPLMKGSKRVKCVGCGMVYPCKSKCSHLDCARDKRQQRIEI